MDAEIFTNFFSIIILKFESWIYMEGIDLKF